MQYSSKLADPTALAVFWFPFAAAALLLLVADLFFWVNPTDRPMTRAVTARPATASLMYFFSTGMLQVLVRLTGAVAVRKETRVEIVRAALVDSSWWQAAAPGRGRAVFGRLCISGMR